MAAEQLRALAAADLEPLAADPEEDVRIAAALPALSHDVTAQLIREILQDRLPPLQAAVDFIRANTKELPPPPPPPLPPLSILQNFVWSLFTRDALFSCVVALSWALIPLFWVWIDNTLVDHNDVTCTSNLVVVGGRWGVVTIVATIAIRSGKARVNSLPELVFFFWGACKAAWRVSEVAVSLFPENVSVVPLGGIIKLARLALLLGLATFCWALAWSFCRLNIYPFVPSGLSSFSLQAVLATYQLVTSLVLVPLRMWVASIITHSSPVRFLHAYFTGPLNELLHLLVDAQDLLLSIPTMFAWPAAFRMSSATMQRRAMGVGAGVVQGLRDMVPPMPPMPVFYYPNISAFSYPNITGITGYHLLFSQVSYPNITGYSLLSYPNVTLPPIPDPWAYIPSAAVGGWYSRYASSNSSNSSNSSSPTLSPSLEPTWSRFAPTHLGGTSTDSSSNSTSGNGTLSGPSPSWVAAYLPPLPSYLASGSSPSNTSTNSTKSTQPPAPMSTEPASAPTHTHTGIPTPTLTATPTPPTNNYLYDVLGRVAGPVAALMQTTGEAALAPAPASAPAGGDAAAPAVEPTVNILYRGMGLA